MTGAVLPLERPEVQGHMGLVHRVAQRFRWALGACLDYEDLIQAGTIGLMTACVRFDAARGFRFSSYAEYWIWHHVSREALNHGRTVRVPVWAQDRMRRTGHSLAPTFSLDAPLQRGASNGATYLDALAATLPDPSVALANAETQRAVAVAMNRLPARTRVVLEGRFHDELNLREIGEPLGLSRERVRQIEAEGLERLRRLLESERTAR